VTIGSQEAMFAACLTLLDPGDELLYPDPGYPAYPVVARLVGAVGVPYPLSPDRGFRLDPEDVRSRLSERTRLVLVCSPSNPTGAIHRASDLERLARMLDEHGAAWVSDEIYSAYRYDVPCPSLSTLSPGNGVVVSGLSKDMSMTGWRVGWVAGPPHIVTRIVAAHQYLVTCASTLSQKAALAAFTEQGERERDRLIARFRRRRDLMATELTRVPGIRFDLPEGAFYFFVDVSRHGPCLPLAHRILERTGVVTIPGVAFGSGGEGYLRLSYAAAEEDIVRGVRAIASELRLS
jgi:aspartate/methionine/tyrosine aminotransferase